MKSVIVVVTILTLLGSLYGCGQSISEDNQSYQEETVDTENEEKISYEKQEEIKTEYENLTAVYERVNQIGNTLSTEERESLNAAKGMMEQVGEMDLTTLSSDTDADSLIRQIQTMTEQLQNIEVSYQK